MRPGEEDHRRCDRDDEGLERQDHAPVVPEAVAARALVERVVLVPDWAQEGTGGSECVGHALGLAGLFERLGHQ